MIVYRDADAAVAPRPLLSACRRTLEALAAGRGGHAEAVEALIDFGELEAALADSLFPERDGLDPVAASWRRAALALGHLVRASWHGATPLERRERARTAAGEIAAAERGPLPGMVRRRVSEGYAWYALYPETYLEAAERFAEANRPQSAVCVGIRSIGTSLSAVVGAAIDAAGCRVDMISLRPRGHPFDRRPALTPELAAFLAERRDSWFLVVDEGPGLSGSSFCGTAAALAGLGIPDDRIVLFPAWLPDGSAFVSDLARGRWPKHPKAQADFESAWLPRGRLGPITRELSGGQWRDRLLPAPARWPAVQPQHERRKFLIDEAGRPVLLKFAGLGRYGRPRLARAERLAAAGFAPPARGLRDGFLALDWVAGRPLDRRDAGPALLARIADYLVHLGRAEVTGEPVRAAELAHMVETNVAEGLGGEWLGRLRGLDRHLSRLGDVPAVAVDGRMLPHEWLATEKGFLKTDALDHADDHFFPGTQDIAWDLAGAAAEFGLGTGAAATLAQAVAERTGDPGLAARLPFQSVAYLAWRLGYASLAAGTLGDTPDGRRFGASVRRYRRLLMLAIERLP